MAEFEHASEAVTAALSFQAVHAVNNASLKDDLRPGIRVGIAMGEVVIADNTVTGAGVVQAQRIVQLAETGYVCISAAFHEALSRRMPFDLEILGEQVPKGFEHPVHVYRIALKPGASVPLPEPIGGSQTPSRNWVSAFTFPWLCSWCLNRSRFLRLLTGIVGLRVVMAQNKIGPKFSDQQVNEIRVHSRPIWQLVDRS